MFLKEFERFSGIPGVLFLTNFEMISEIPGGLLFREFKRILEAPDLLKFMKEFRELLVFYFSENLKESWRSQEAFNFGRIWRNLGSPW